MNYGVICFYNLLVINLKMINERYKYGYLFQKFCTYHNLFFKRGRTKFLKEMNQIIFFV